MRPKTVEEVLVRIDELEREYLGALTRLAWGSGLDSKSTAIDVTHVGHVRTRLAAARDLLKLLRERPELDPLHSMVHPGAL